MSDIDILKHLSAHDGDAMFERLNCHLVGSRVEVQPWAVLSLFLALALAGLVVFAFAVLA